MHLSLCPIWFLPHCFACCYIVQSFYANHFWCISVNTDALRDMYVILTPCLFHVLELKNNSIGLAARTAAPLSLNQFFISVILYLMARNLQKWALCFKFISLFITLVYKWSSEFTEEVVADIINLKVMLSASDQSVQLDTWGWPLCKSDPSNLEETTECDSWIEVPSVTCDISHIKAACRYPLSLCVIWGQG